MTKLQQWLFVLLGMVAGAARAFGADTIGVASAVTNDVTGTLDNQQRTLQSGDGVSQKETIDTGKESAAQLLFNDETTLTVGPESTVTLDQFVYDPTSNTGKVALNVAKGAFRFITGSAAPQSYEVKTPVATMGVRGTIADGYYDPVANTFTLVATEGTLIVDGHEIPEGKMQAWDSEGNPIYDWDSLPDAEQVGWFQVAGIVPFPLIYHRWQTDEDTFEFPLDPREIVDGVTPPFETSPPPPPPVIID